MARSTPAVIDVDPAKLAAWRARRQHIAPPAQKGDLEEVATDLVGIQAQVPSSAALSLALRTRDGRIDDAPRAVADRRLVRSWGMRGTLHLWAADDFPLIVAALGQRETWRRPVWFRYFGVTEAEMEALIEAVGDILGDGRPRSRSELAARIGDRLGPQQAKNLGGSWGTYLKPAAMRGLLCHAAGEGSAVTFTRPDVWLGRWRKVDPDEALVTVVRRYLRAYGPASKQEIARWWGNAVSTLKPALTALADELVEIEAGDVRGLFLRGELEHVSDQRPDQEPRFLGAFDPLTIGIGRRDWFLPAAHTSRVSRTAGWISPIVVLNGRVAGVWTGRMSGGAFELTIDLFERPAGDLKRRVAAAAGRVASAHGASLDLRYGPVYATPSVARDEA
jgi:winged helix DNA-binding protein